MMNIIGGWKGWLLFAAMGFSCGWQVHSWKVGSAEGRSFKQGLKVAQDLNVKADKIVESKIQQEQAIRVVYRTIRERVRDVQDDRVCFTSESLSLWNDAIAGADTHRSEPAGETREANSVAEGQASAKDILENAATNYQVCNSNLIKHNALIDTIESIKSKICLCDQE